jgi:ParB-like chromosome segregation protein Spo0J
MSKPDQNAAEPKPEKSRVKRKLSKIPFRGWAVQIGDQSIDVTPALDEIAKAVQLAKAGQQELRAFSDNPQKLADEIAAQAQGNRDRFVQLSRDYHADRVAYLVLNGWAEFPLEVMANGDMRDGQHRWLAATFLGMDEVEIVVIEN